MLRRSFLALPLALAACAATPGVEGEEETVNPANTSGGARRFKGVWDFHFETSAFAPENGGEGGQGPYWLSGEGDVWRALTAPFGATGRPWGEVAVEIEGELSGPGRYGHMGAYTRELRVTRVFSATLIRSR
ncbi:MAG: hypothetical protein JNJ73_02455 [Hyphomonadaceae bacterium]|nr:hypothetical protein [Hyphomonadaceae bacterium]